MPKNKPELTQRRWLLVTVVHRQQSKNGVSSRMLLMDAVVVSVIIVAGIVVIMATAHASATSKANMRLPSHRVDGVRRTEVRMGYDMTDVVLFFFVKCRRGRLHRWRQLRMRCRHIMHSSRMGYDSNKTNFTIITSRVCHTLDYFPHRNILSIN